MKYVFCCSLVIFLLTFLFFDFGFLNNSITDYGAYCVGDIQDSLCLGSFSSARKETYYINESGQHVLTKGPLGASKYTDCAIVDRKNWSCVIADPDEGFGFSEGVYFSYGNVGEDIFPDIYSRYTRISKLNYLLIKYFNKDNFVDDFLPNHLLRNSF